ncbi:phage tail assembly protein T [Ursidibacter sp. B-7004-1]
MPESHYQEYQRFYQEQPFGLWREDYRTAQIAHILAMINRDPKGEAPTLSDYMPFFNEQKESTDDDGVADYLAKR